MTGYVWGNLFFATIDVPFLFAMCWATLAIMMMARGDAPRWGATVMAGVFMGLAIATRTGGIITHAYLIGAMGLCALDAVLRRGAAARPLLWRMAVHAIAAVALAWMVATALWPWLQLGNPFSQFAARLCAFRRHPDLVRIPQLGHRHLHRRRAVVVHRRPDAGAAAGSLSGPARHRGRVRHRCRRWHGRAPPSPACAATASPALPRRRRRWPRARAPLLVAVAALGPLLVLIVQGSTLYDGIRHVLFTIPMLALLAAWGAVRLLPLMRRLPVIAGAATAAQAALLAATLVILHPLEYVAMNAVAGGVAGARGDFELDYWSIAVADALRKLEARLDADPRFVNRPPRVMICIGWREQMAGALLAPCVDPGDGAGQGRLPDRHRALSLRARHRCAD